MARNRGKKRNQGPKGNAGDADPKTPGFQTNAEVTGRPANIGGPPSQLQPMPPSGPMTPPPTLGPSMGLTPAPTGQVVGQYGGMVTPDADGRGFTNADGGHDWNVGQGPGGNFGGQTSRTGQSIIGTEVQSGDALGHARGTQQYRDATAARQAWIQSNLSQGRTLADLGMEPTRGGGLANFMSLGSTLHPGAVGGGVSTAPTQPLGTPVNPDGSMRGPISPGGPAPAMPGAPIPPVASTPITGPGAAPRGRTEAPAGLGATGVNNSLGSLGTGLGGSNNALQRERVASPTAGLPRGGASLGGSMGLGGGSLYGQRRLY